MATQLNVEQREKVSLEITGMTCASCSARIEKGLAKLPGVLKVNVNFAAEKAAVEYDPSRVDQAKMADLVKDLGYGVRESGV
jgi:P-type Cu+ transporter